MTPSVENCRVFPKQVQVMLVAKHLRQLLKASLTPCVTCPPAPWRCFLLPAEESGSTDWDTPLQGPGCVCWETICSSGLAVKEQN